VDRGRNCPSRARRRDRQPVAVRLRRGDVAALAVGAATVLTSVVVVLAPNGVPGTADLIPASVRVSPRHSDRVWLPGRPAGGEQRSPAHGREGGAADAAGRDAPAARATGSPGPGRTSSGAGGAASADGADGAGAKGAAESDAAAGTGVSTAGPDGAASAEDDRSGVPATGGPATTPETGAPDAAPDASAGRTTQHGRPPSLGPGSGRDTTGRSASVSARRAAAAE